MNRHAKSSAPAPISAPHATCDSASDLTPTPTPAPAFATVPGNDYAADYAPDEPDEPEYRVYDIPVMRTFVPETTLHASRRLDGWSADNQRTFLEAIAEGHGVDVAARRVNLTASSAYAFRRTAKGAAFALGWRAASLVARDALAETLLVRAMEGTMDTVVRGDTIITRHRFDNRLALTLLARLDRQVESAPDADVKAARLVAQEFDAYLDIVGKGEGAARAGLFLARRAGGLAEGAKGGRTAANDDGPDLAPIYALAAADRFMRTGVATAGEVDIADLDPAARANWTGDQWLRAEAAGLVAVAPPPKPKPEPKPAAAKTPPAPQHSQDWEFGTGEKDKVRWCDLVEDWRTGFPPPPGFNGDEEGDYGEFGYERALSPEELAIVESACVIEEEAAEAEDVAERDSFFATLAAYRPATTEQASAEPVEPATSPVDQGHDHHDQPPPQAA